MSSKSRYRKTKDEISPASEDRLTLGETGQESTRGITFETGRGQVFNPQEVDGFNETVIQEYKRREYEPPSKV